MPTLDYELHERGPEPRHTLVWLHGLGADGHDFAPLIDALELPAGLGLRFVLPHAPVRAVTINGGARMRAWYDFRTLEFGRGESGDDIRESIALIHELLDAERRILPDGGKLLLGGFSQGGVMTLAAGLTASPYPDGLVVLSGYLWRPPDGLEEPPPVFQAHGMHDPLLPFELGLATHRGLLGAGIETEWHGYPMAHAVCPEEIADMSRWLVGVLTR